MKNVSLHILDILQNSIAAEATKVTVNIIDSVENGTLDIDISDDGKGIETELLTKITDPFFTSRTTRKVGLGIPLLKQNCEQTGGNLKIKSKKNVGTTVSATFNKNHFDMLPIGDLPGIFALTITAWDAICFDYTHQTDKGEFNIKTNDIKEILGNTPIGNPEVITFLKEMITENLIDIKAI